MKALAPRSVGEAVRWLPAGVIRQLAEGPLPDRDDCRVCEAVDPWMYGCGPGVVWGEDEGGDRYVIRSDPHAGVVHAVYEWHRDTPCGGYDEEGYQRCLAVYNLARYCTFDLVWWWKSKLVERRGQRCRVICRGTKNSVLVEFEDGARYVTSRWAVRERKAGQLF